MYILYISDVYIDISCAESEYLVTPSLMCVLKQLSFHLAKLGYKDIIQFRQPVVIPMDNDILTHFCIVAAIPLRQAVALQQLLRYRRYPHERLSVVGQDVELTCPFKDKDSPPHILGQFVLQRFIHRHRRHKGIGVRNFKIALQILVCNIFKSGKRTVPIHHQAIAEISHQLVRKPLIVKQCLIKSVEIRRISDYSKLIVVTEDIVYGTPRIGLLVKNLCVRLAVKCRRETSKSLGYIACPRHRDRKSPLFG